MSQQRHALHIMYYIILYIFLFKSLMNTSKTIRAVQCKKKKEKIKRTKNKPQGPPGLNEIIKRLKEFIYPVRSNHE